MSANGFVIIPTAVFYAQEQGFITSEMADCLSLLYRWREHDSNIIHAVSAERLKRGLSLLRPEYGAGKVQFPTAQAIRNWMRGLWEAGWFTRDYVPGVERTYNVYLQIMGGSTHTFVEYAIGHPKGWAQRWAPSEIEGWAKEAVSLSNIKHWKLTSAFQGRATDVPSFLIEGCTPTPIINDTKDQYHSAAVAAGVSPVVPTAGEIVPPASPLVDSVHTCGDVSSSPTLPLSNSNPSTGKATPAGRGKLLKTLYTVQAAELKNTVALPRNRHSRVDMTETAYGFEPVVEDFTKWCRENFERHPKYPLFDYLNIVGERLGAPSVPDVSPAKASDSKDDSQVLKIGTAIYKFTGWSPTNPEKVAELIAMYGFADVDGSVRFHLSGADGKPEHSAEKVRKAKQLLSDGGALVLITEFRKRYRANTIALMMETEKITKEYATAWYDAEPEQTRRQWASALRISTQKLKAQQQAEAAQKAEEAEQYKQTCAAELETLSTDYDVNIDDWFLTHPKPQDYRFNWEETEQRIRDRRRYEIQYAFCSECSRQSMTIDAAEKYHCAVCNKETLPLKTKGKS